MNNQNSPNFIGIGAQKCASTWVYRVLDDHPEAGVSEPKELNFFSYYYDRGFQWYISHFSQVTGSTAIGEISTSYLCDPRAPSRAASFDSGFRVVVTLRDPVERAFSNHLHEIRIKQFSGPDLTFEAGLANNPMYLEQSRYATHLKRWMEYFPREQILVLLQEEIKQDPVHESKRLYRFLGIDTEHQSGFLFRKANPSYAEKYKGLDRVLRTAGQVGRRIGVARLVEYVKGSSFISSVREANQQHLSEMVPVMLPETEKFLRDELAEEVEQLAALLEREDLPWPTWEHIAARRQG